MDFKIGFVSDENMLKGTFDFFFKYTKKFLISTSFGLKPEPELLK